MTNPTHHDTLAADLDPAALSDDRLVKLLAAYQVLQGQNMRMASVLAAQLAVGPADLRVLMYISRRSNVTPKEVATQLAHTSGTITALLDRLETSGHIERLPHPTDRRSLTLQLTNSGHAAVDTVRNAYRSAFTGVFTDTEIDHVATTLNALGDSLDRAISTTTAQKTASR